MLQKAQGSSRRKSLQKPEWLSLSGLSFTFDWSRGKGEFLFPLKKITKISKAKRKQSYNIFDTHLKISLSNYSSSLFLKYYFCTGRVAQGYILKAEGAVIRVKRWCRTLSIKFVPTPFLTYALLVVSFPEIFLNCCFPKKSFKREIKPLKELASSHA